MARGTWLFWALIAALLGASAFFAQGAERQRNAALAGQATIRSGDVVRLVSVIDGDTVIVAREGGEQVAVRVIGIKAFSSARDKDPAAPYGRAAIDQIRRMLDQRAVRVLAHDPPRDRHGRTLATLFVEGHDVGLELIRGGHVLAYTAFPFPALPMYLQAQEQARGDRAGLWSDPEVVARAEALLTDWRSPSP
ncbi:thermonuclease family protein [Sorangium sp. So ce1036]|uniref:thermonuclease family protein n=1 Tax=Sorangium sp. So ce1036 TaxID=3133328 RepID=UPI003EFBB581